jgi:hypothetical protein
VDKFAGHSHSVAKLAAGFEGLAHRLVDPSSASFSSGSQAKRSFIKRIFDWQGEKRAAPNALRILQE